MTGGMAVLVVDMQNDFVRPGAPVEVPAAQTVIPAIQRISAAARACGVPVIYTQHLLEEGFDVSPLETEYNPILQRVGMRRGTLGAEIVDELRPEGTDLIVEKHRYDAFFNTRLDSLLSTVRGLRAIDTLVITGTLTEVCCESTARSAFMRDYRVLFVSDATGALSPEAQRATEHAIDTFFGRVVDSGTVIAMLS
jgi:nicotinamidase-related amidase